MQLLELKPTLNDAALALMTSIGHWISLFDTRALWLSAVSAATAQKDGLSEGYVRTWLAVMGVSSC